MSALPACSVKPPKLPSEQFRPKQSLGQNFLTDPNYIFKIVRSLNDQSPGKEYEEEEEEGRTRGG